MAPRKGKPFGDFATSAIKNAWTDYSAAINPAGVPNPKAPGTRQTRVMPFPAFYNTLLGLSNGVEPGDGGERAYTFEDIRQFADDHEITRLVIETCKEQLCKLRWTWRVTPRPGETEVDIRDRSEKSRSVQNLNKFFKSPDKEHDFPQWLRIMIEELLVCDTAVLWKHETYGGDVYAIRIIDTATMRRLIDDMGVTPNPDLEYPFNIAYQQIIMGEVNEEYTTNEMIYYIRNPRVWAFNGYSPVEQIMLTLATGMQRMAMQLAHYTEGNVPAMFLRAPKEWTITQIKEFQEYWNALLSGNLGELAKGWMIPGDIDPVFPQKEVLKDEFDEWIARVVSYAFSVSPNAFIKNLNRATSEQSREQSDEEGLQARMSLVRNILNLAQEKWFGYQDVEFHLIYDRPQDSRKQSEIDNIDIRNGVKSVDEVRRERGYPPIGVPNRVYTNNGFIPLLAGDKGGFDIFQQKILTSSDPKNPASDTGAGDSGTPPPKE